MLVSDLSRHLQVLGRSINGVTLEFTPGIDCGGDLVSIARRSGSCVIGRVTCQGGDFDTCDKSLELGEEGEAFYDKLMFHIIDALIGFARDYGVHVDILLGPLFPSVVDWGVWALFRPGGVKCHVFLTPQEVVGQVVYDVVMECRA